MASAETDDVVVLVSRGVKLPVASILNGAVALLVSPSVLGSGELLLEELGVQQGARAYGLKPHKGRYSWKQIKAAEIPPRVDDKVHVFVVKPAQSDISDSDVIKRKLEEIGAHLWRVDSELKRIKYAPSQTDYVAIGKEFQGRKDWVESHSVFQTFDVTDR